MKVALSRFFTAIACIFLFMVSPCFSQSLPRFGVGAKFSTLGIGVEAATAVTRQSNVRGGFNFLGAGDDFSYNGIKYNGQVRFRSVETHFDWFFAGKFHVSPGLLVYNGNRVSADASVPGGQSFTLGDQSYFSSPTDPVTGKADFEFSKRNLMPMITAGWGNLLSRSDKRFSIHIEGGLIFGASPESTLSLAGSTCVAPSGPCQSIDSNPLVQSQIRDEEAKFKTGAPPYNTVHDVLKFYPVVSIGIGYKIR